MSGKIFSYDFSITQCPYFKTLFSKLDRWNLNYMYVFEKLIYSMWIFFSFKYKMYSLETTNCLLKLRLYVIIKIMTSIQYITTFSSADLGSIIDIHAKKNWWLHFKWGIVDITLQTVFTIWMKVDLHICKYDPTELYESIYRIFPGIRRPICFAIYVIIQPKRNILVIELLKVHLLIH